MPYDLEMDRVATTDLLDAPASVAEMESRVDLILASGTPAAGQRAGPATTHSQWPELLKAVVFPVFMGLAYKALHELLPAHAEALLKRFREQPQNYTASRRLDDVSQLLPSRDDQDFDNFRLASNLLDVMAHLISAITDRDNGSVLAALQPPLKQLLNLLSASSVGFGSGPLLSLAVPQLLKLLELFFSQQAPAGEQVKSYLRLLLADDSKRLAGLLLPTNLQWLPDFFQGWGLLLDAYLAEPEEAHDASPSSLAERGWRIIQAVKRGPLGALLRERLNELFSPSIVNLIMDPQAVWSDVREQVMALSSALGNASVVVGTLGTFPHCASLGDKLAWGFAFLKSEQASAVIQLLMPARIATPLLATAGITRRLDELPEGIDFKQAVSSSLVALKASGDADYVNSLLPGTLDTLVQGLDYWDPLANAISALGATAEQSGGVGYLRKVAALSKALLGMALEALRDFCIRTVQQGKVVSTSLTALSIALCFFYKRSFPKTLDGLLGEALKLLPLLLPGATGLVGCLLAYKTLVSSEVFNIIRVSEEATGPEHDQILLDHLAERLVALMPASPVIARFGELMMVLPTLIGLVMEPLDSVEEHSWLERIAGILIKLNASQDPLVSEYVHRIKLLLVSRLTGMTEAEAAPFVPRARGSTTGAVGTLNLRLGLSGLETMAAQVLEDAGESSLQSRLANKLRTLVPLNRFMTVWKFFSVVGIGGVDAGVVPGSSAGQSTEAASLALAGFDDPALAHPTVQQSLASRNTQAKVLIGSGVSTLVLTAFLAWYGYKWATRSQAPRHTPDPEQGSTPLIERSAQSSPTLHGASSHDYASVPLVQPMAPPSDDVPMSPAKKKWAVAIGAAITGVIGASLIGVGTHRLMTRSAIETLVTQPGQGEDHRSLNEVMLDAFNAQIASEQTDEQRLRSGSTPIWTGPELEVAIVQLGLDAGYTPSAEELSGSPLLALLWAEAEQSRIDDASTTPHWAETTEENAAQAEASLSSGRNKRDLMTIHHTGADFQAPDLMGGYARKQAGTQLIHVLKESQVPLADLAEIAAKEQATEEAVQWMVEFSYAQMLAARTRVPEHLADVTAYAKHWGDLIYSSLGNTIPKGVPNTYDAKREHEILVHQPNPDAMGRFLWVVSSVLNGGNNAQSARDRNPYNYKSETDTDARWTIHDKIRVTEEQMMTGQFQYENGLPAELSTDTRQSAYVGLPVPKDIIERMLHVDLEALYAQELQPLLPRLKPGLELGLIEQVHHVLRDRIGIVGYDPVAALESGSASLHQVLLNTSDLGYAEPFAELDSRALRNAVGFTDMDHGLKFVLFLNAGYMIDLSDYLPTTVEERQAYARQGEVFNTMRIDEFKDMTHMLRSQPPHNKIIHGRHIVENISLYEIEKARIAKKPDGTSLWDPDFVKRIKGVTRHAAHGVTISFGEKQSTALYAESQIGFYGLDLLKKMDMETRSNEELNYISWGDTFSFMFSVVAIALGLISIIPVFSATNGLLLGAGSALAGILGATSAQWPRTIMSDSPEEADAAFSQWMISVLMELVAFGVGVKVDLAVNKLSDFLDFIGGGLKFKSENLETLLLMRPRLRPGRIARPANDIVVIADDIADIASDIVVIADDIADIAGDIVVIADDITDVADDIVNDVLRKADDIEVAVDDLMLDMGKIDYAKVHVEDEASNIGAKERADAQARLTVRSRNQLQHSDINEWIAKHPDRFKAILDNSLSAVFAPFIVGGAMTGGSAISKFILSWQKKLDDEEGVVAGSQQDATTDASSASTTDAKKNDPLSDPANLSEKDLKALLERLLKNQKFREALNEQVRLHMTPPAPVRNDPIDPLSLNEVLVVDKGERYQVKAHRMIPEWNREFLFYRQLPRGVSASVADESFPLPSNVSKPSGGRNRYEIRPEDRWVIVDSQQILTYGIYAFGAGKLYKLALSPVDQRADGPRRDGYYQLRHVPGRKAEPFREVLMEAHGQPIVKNTQERGASMGNAAQRWAIWQQAITQAGIESSMAPGELDKLNAARNLRIALEESFNLTLITAGQMKVFTASLLVRYVNGPEQGWKQLGPHALRVDKHLQDIRASLDQSDKIRRDASGQPDLKPTLDRYEEWLKTLRDHESNILKIHNRMQMLETQRPVLTRLDEGARKIDSLNAELAGYENTDREIRRRLRLNSEEYERLDYYEVDVMNNNRKFKPHQDALDELTREFYLIPKATDSVVLAHAKTELHVAWLHFEADMKHVNSTITDVAELLRPSRVYIATPPPKGPDQQVRGLPIPGNQRKPDTGGSN